MRLPERDLQVEYRVRAPGFGVDSVSLAGAPLPIRQRANRYRPAGVLVSRAGLGDPSPEPCRITVQVGGHE